MRKHTSIADYRRWFVANYSAFRIPLRYWLYYERQKREGK